MEINDDIAEVVLDNNVRSIYITDDEGYKPIIECRDILIDEMNFTLETEYGITDMTQDYSYQDKKYFLKYLSDLDLIVFQSAPKNVEELNLYRGLASRLINERKKKLEDDSYSKSS